LTAIVAVIVALFLRPDKPEVTAPSCRPQDIVHHCRLVVSTDPPPLRSVSNHGPARRRHFGPAAAVMRRPCIRCRLIVGRTVMRRLLEVEMCQRGHCSSVQTRHPGMHTAL